MPGARTLLFPSSRVPSVSTGATRPGAQAGGAEPLPSSLLIRGLMESQPQPPWIPGPPRVTVSGSRCSVLPLQRDHHVRASLSRASAGVTVSGPRCSVLPLQGLRGVIVSRASLLCPPSPAGSPCQGLPLQGLRGGHRVGASLFRPPILSTQLRPFPFVHRLLNSGFSHRAHFPFPVPSGLLPVTWRLLPSSGELPSCP